MRSDFEDDDEREMANENVENIIRNFNENEVKDRK